MTSEQESTETITEDVSDKSGTAEQENTGLNIGKAVGKIASLMKEKGALSTGDLAELRRISPDQPFTPALWRILLMFDLNESPGWISQEQWERRWATLLMVMAHNIGLHNYRVSFGQALANAGWSELRFVQLMKSNGETLEKHLRRVAQFLAGKNQEADWSDAARLLFTQSGESGEKIRLSISRNYYSALYAQENN
ncbi:MAG: type I-E CRISPR-associated protein Cse2/CasB [Bacteroidetes bacterium]|jgi:CRISPR system Cascade subunit CasB|nr:type I-E CRISPR-associated protein Cse2/CasB [Bacteroidota bacterium]